MILIKNKIQLQKELGKEYTFFEILKLKGIGSPRIISLNSTHDNEKGTTIRDNRLFCNFKLFPLGIAILNTRQNIALKNNDIERIEFIERPIKINTRFGIRTVYDAKIIFATSNSKLQFYCPKQSFKSLKVFLKKECFENKVIFLVNRHEQKDLNPLIVEYIIDVMKIF